jgi:hypothetical protein
MIPKISAGADSSRICYGDVERVNKPEDQMLLARVKECQDFQLHVDRGHSLT